jgi:hypothetical protein
MKHTLINQGKRAGIALAAAAAFTALGIGTAQAQEFASANVSIDREGALECTFRETGLPPGGVVRYDCTAQYVGVRQQCMLKNRPVGNSQLLNFEDISGEEVENFEIPRNGQVRAGIVTPIPESPNTALICTAPSELTVTAIRWCAPTLVDLTNNITGVTVDQLFDQLVPNGSGSVPECSVLENGPFTPPGE